MHGKIREIIKMQRLIGSLQQMMHVLNSNGYIRHYHVNITLGVAEAVSKQKYISNGHTYGHRLNLAHNLLGCPETEIWTNTPSQFTSASVYGQW